MLVDHFTHLHSKKPAFYQTKKLLYVLQKFTCFFQHVTATIPLLCFRKYMLQKISQTKTCPFNAKLKGVFHLNDLAQDTLAARPIDQSRVHPSKYKKIHGKFKTIILSTTFVIPTTMTDTSLYEEAAQCLRNLGFETNIDLLVGKK